MNTQSHLSTKNLTCPKKTLTGRQVSPTALALPELNIALFVGGDNTVSAPNSSKKGLARGIILIIVQRPWDAYLNHDGCRILV